MDENYIENIYKKYKSGLNEKEVNSKEDLKNIIIDYIVSNLQYDFNITIDPKKLFYAKTSEQFTL